MSLDGTSNTFIPYTINGINPVAGSINTTNFVKYSGNTSNTDLDGFDLVTAGTISAQNFAIPDNNTNDESWITYSISTMGNLSTIGGLITTDLTNGRSMYFTGGVLGAPNFQFATLGNGGKVITTDANGVFSTTISAGQLDYITGLTSQAGGIGQQNTWTQPQIYNANLSTTGSNQFIQPYNATALDISTLVNRATLDSAIAGLGAGILTLNNTWSGTNTFQNILTTGAEYTTNLNGALQTLQNATQFNPTLDANSYFVTGIFPTTYTFTTNWTVNPVSGTTANIALDPAIFYFDTNHKYVISFTGIYGTGATWVGTVFNNSTSLTVSDAPIAITTTPQNLTMTFTAGSSNPAIYLRFVGASGTLRWTNFTIKEVDLQILGNVALSSEIDSNVVQSNGRTANLAGGLKVNQTSLATASSLTTASLPAGVSASSLSGSYTLTATAGGSTFGMWLGTGFTYTAGAKYNFTFTGFSTNATATQAMILYTNTYTGGSGTFIGDYIVNVPITSSTISGSFTATSNNNVVWNFISSASGRSISFTGFTLTRADTSITGIATLPTNAGTATVGLALNASNQIITTALPVAPPSFSAVTVGSVPYESAIDTFSNSLITQGTYDLGYTGASFTASTGIASITFSSPTYTANSNASVQGIINATVLPTTAIGLPCIATFTALTFPLFATAPYPYFTLTSGATVVYTSAVGASGTIVMPFIPTSTTLFITIFFKSPPTGVSVPVLTWTNFTITTPSMTTTGFNTTTGRQTVGELASAGTIIKQTTTAGSFAQIAGGDASFSPYLEFFAGGTSRGYLGDCNSANMYVASENGATLNFLTQGALRMTIDSSGFTTLASKELRASSFTSAAGGQIRLTQGTTGTGYGLMLYNDGGGFYILLSNNGDAFGNFNALRPFFIELGSGRVNMNNNFTARGGSYFLESLPQQTDQYSWPVCINTSQQLVRSQCLTYNAVQNNSTAWGGGYNLGNAFYRYNSFVAVNIIGKLSYYVGGTGLAYPQFRIYSQSSGQTWTYDLRAYFNITYNHTTFPFSINFGQAQTTATGWFDVYIYNGGGVITDANDQLWYNVNMYPGNNY